MTRCGVTAGAVPFQLAPGAMELLDENDRTAFGNLRDQEAAAAGFARGFEGFRSALLGSHQEIGAGFRTMFGPHDREVLDRTGALEMVAALRASLVHGTTGAGWDNVAWVGPWEIDLADVRRPVHLWYGDDDPVAAADAGPWMRGHLPDATLHILAGDGHLAVVEHIREVVATLTGD